EQDRSDGDGGFGRGGGAALTGLAGGRLCAARAGAGRGGNLRCSKSWRVTPDAPAGRTAGAGREPGPGRRAGGGIPHAAGGGRTARGPGGVVGSGPLDGIVALRNRGTRHGKLRGVARSDSCRRFSGQFRTDGARFAHRSGKVVARRVTQPTSGSSIQTFS